jgi:hypothetical protein
MSNRQSNKEYVVVVVSLVDYRLDGKMGTKSTNVKNDRSNAKDYSNKVFNKNYANGWLQVFFHLKNNLVIVMLSFTKCNQSSLSQTFDV